MIYIRNRPLFQKIIDKIENDPHSYCQLKYKTDRNDTLGGDCGSAYCIAGWACHLEGYKVHESGYINFTYEHCADVARQLLKLSMIESLMLFAEDWEPRQGLTVVDALKQIMNGKCVEEVSAL